MTDQKTHLMLIIVHQLMLHREIIAVVVPVTLGAIKATDTKTTTKIDFNHDKPIILVQLNYVSGRDLRRDLEHLTLK